MLFSDNSRAALAMLLAMAGFVVNDTFVKLASETIAPAQIMAVRGLFAASLLLLIAGRMKALRPLRLALSPRLALRTVADVAATLSYITALAHMPIANASAIFQALPMTVTIGAALFFHEPVGWRRWTAIAVGFVGVLVIVRPGTEGFTVYSVSVLASVLFSAVRDLSTRRLDRAVPSLFIALVTALSVSAVGWILLPFSGGLRPIGAATWLHLLGAAMAIAVGYIFIVQSMRIGDMGFVAPFRYAILVYAIAMGYLVFGDVPAVPTLVGAAIVVSSGVYMLYRERVRGIAAPVRTQIH